ncbi:MAG: helix-turn-helix domain-containing protein [Eubacterium sp.]
MDQIKTGKFISEMRKKKSYTQRQLADILGISDRTVSKWETGKGMPDVSLMLPLCDALDISINELLSGEIISDNDYRERAEKNIMSLVKEKEESKKKIILSAVVCALTIISGITLILASGLIEMQTQLRVILMIIAFVVIAGGIAVACVLDVESGTYECPKCGERFVPTLGAYIAGPHTITKRQLKCPHCGKVSYCKKRLTH